MASTVVIRIPNRMAPLILRYISAVVISKPMMASQAVGLRRSPRPTSVASLLTTIPALRKPRNARNAPIRP